MTNKNSSTPVYRYALVTSAYNEVVYLENTIKAVIAQQIPPLRWVIVSDGSIDGTDELIVRYAARVPYIRYLRREKDDRRGFASKVRALQIGARLIDFSEVDFIGHLDGDVSVAPTYFRDLLLHFQQDPELGIGGGYIHELRRGAFAPRRHNHLHSVAGAVQMFRTECYEQIDGLKPLVYGGEDTHANVAAQMSHWKVHSFPDLQVLHHRPSGTTQGRLQWHYRQGLMDYSLGCLPAFEIAKSCARLASRPPVIGAFARLSAFVLASIRRLERPVTAEFVKFLRAQQGARLFLYKGIRGLLFVLRSQRTDPERAVPHDPY